MTFDEALAEIELAPGADADAIRRAYLRKLKTRSPETDPEGFRRLREAFELLRGTAEAPDGPAPAAGPRETAEAPEQALPDPLDDIRQILDLHAQDLPVEAVQAQERLAQHLRTVSRETEVLDTHSAALWQIAQEISRLPPGFPPAVRTAIARAVHDGTLETALPSVQSVVQEDPDAGWRMASDLKELPALCELYHGAVLAALPAWKGHEPVEINSKAWNELGTVGVWIFRIVTFLLLAKSCSSY